MRGENARAPVSPDVMCKREVSMDKQSLLNAQYAKYWDDITEIQKNNIGLSAPLLIKVPISYFSQRLKLMVIGQQTKGWGTGNIEDLLRCYEEFNFGEYYYSSPFWNVTRKIENILQIQNYSIVWTNLNRCDFNDGRPPHEIENELHTRFPVLASEIEILRPDIVIFFSGPYFDEHIKRPFKGVKFHAVNGFNEREMVRVEHDFLPYNAYRTYHPKYLRISGVERRFVGYIKKINT